MGAIVVTGAGGFVGRRLVGLLEARGETVVGLGRSPQPDWWSGKALWIVNDLSQSDSYRAALQGADCVIHLAAVTGKAKPEQYRRSNVDATRVLLKASSAAGVRRFVLVSSIAAIFKDRRYYHYAASKIAAEEIVRSAPMETIIVRPTMIMGPGSPIQASLEKLAKAPVIPVFGDGECKVQPVDVDDVAEALAGLAREPDAAGQVIEIGGPNIMSMNELLATIRACEGAGDAPRFVHLPLAPIRSVLAMLESPLLSVLPLTAGQLASFANDGVAAESPVLDRILPHRREVPAARPPPTGSGGRTLPPVPPVTKEAEVDLKRELGRYARYLVGEVATPYQERMYIEGHRRRLFAPQSAFDGFLMRFSGWGGAGLALADAYSGLFDRACLLRKKLMLSLAILECSPPSFVALDKPDPGGRLAIVTMGARLVPAAGVLLAGVVVLLPAKLMHMVLGKPGS